MGNKGGRGRKSMLGVMRRSLLLMALGLVSIASGQKSSFASTKFDLDANLPAEEPIIAPNKDPEPTTVTKPTEVVTTPTTTAAPVQPVHVPTPELPQPIAIPPPPPSPLTPPPTLPPPSPAPPPAPHGQAVLAPVAAGPFPALPPLLPLPSVPENGVVPLPPQIVPLVATPTLPPLPPPPPHQQQIVPFSASNIGPPLAGFVQPPPTNTNQLVANRQTAPQPSQRPAGQSPTTLQNDRIELWFREDFDLTNCARDPESISRAFKKKFPRNLLRNGKESVLAELLSSRIKDCQTKQDNNHWIQVDRLLPSSDLPMTEKEECRAGLVQEQISCLNVLSFSCQFVQPAYNFRLVPTRLIVQEARLAEDGSDKCQKFVRKIKHQLSH